LCALVTSLGIDGLMVSPGYQYESATENIFLTRGEVQKQFERVPELANRYPLGSTPMYLECVAGKRDYNSTPWSTVIFTPKVWKAPCSSSASRTSRAATTSRTETDSDYLGVTPGPALRRLRNELRLLRLRRAQINFAGIDRGQCSAT